MNRHKLISAVILTAALTPAGAFACTCVATASTGAIQISSLVAGGSASVASALTIGLEGTSAQYQASSGQAASQIVGAIDALTKKLAKEIRNVPMTERAIENSLNRVSPARHGTHECSYVDRTGDLSAAGTLASLQQENLNRAAYAYNEMTSSYPAGANPTARFMAQTGSLIKNKPEIKTSGMKIVKSAGEMGAMTPEELQDASTAINLMLNPNPPARSPEATTLSSISQNVEADLYNLRMSVPQAVSQALLSYEGPIVSMDQDSWFTEAVKRMGPQIKEQLEESGDQVSQSDLLRVMATHRIKDPSWVVNVGAKDKQGLLKDLALAKADHLAMDYELWVQDRYNSLMMSQLLASQIRKER